MQIYLDNMKFPVNRDPEEIKYDYIIIRRLQIIMSRIRKLDIIPTLGHHTDQ